jgi:hypothetical protein
MFATHPMSSARYATARGLAKVESAGLAERPRNRERFMDNTATLRSVKRGDKARYAYRRLVGWGVIRAR